MQSTQTPPRRHPRRLLSAPLAVLIRSDVLRGYTVNIGEGGLGAALPRMLAINEKVIVSFEQFGLAVLASVRYNDGFLHGFEFHMLGPRQLSLLKTLCAGDSTEAAGAAFP